MNKKEKNNLRKAKALRENLIKRKKDRNNACNA